MGRAPGSGRVSPRLKVVEGSERLLRALLGCLPGHKSVSLSHRPYVLRGSVTIAQPGLSWTDFETKLATEDLSATQVRDLLATFDDALGPLGRGDCLFGLTVPVVEGDSHCRRVLLGGATQLRCDPIATGVSRRREAQPVPQAEGRAATHSLVRWNPDARIASECYVHLAISTVSGG